MENTSKWNADVTTMKISKDTHKMLEQIKRAYQDHFKCNITFNEIVAFLLVPGNGDERLHVILNELF